MIVRGKVFVVCDEIGCDDHEAGLDTDAALERAKACGWSHTEDGRDFCFVHTRKREALKPPSAFVPEGVRLFTAIDAMREAGFDLSGFTGEEGWPLCCGERADIVQFIGCPFRVECESCGKAVKSVVGARDDADLEDPVCWALVDELDRAEGATP